MITSGPLPMFRKEFKVARQLSRATVYICGLGFFELHINGRKVGDHVLEPGWTNYRRSALYLTYDVETFLHPGGNAIGVMIGNGMYNVAGGRYVKFNASFGRPRFIFYLHMEYQDGTSDSVVSDETWTAAPSPVRFSCIYGGEDYDARDEQPGWDEAGFRTKGWEPAEIMDIPREILVSQDQPPIKVMQVFHPVKITEPAASIRVYDLGQNFSGWPEITVRGTPGSQVRLTPGELLDAKGFVTQESSGGPVYFTYTLKGGAEETWHPRFSYYGFRYIQLEGKAEVLKLEGQFLYSSAPTAGGFSCSNQLFNRIHQLILAAIRSNLQSVVTDCPHREKLGWLEVPYLMAPSIGYNYDLSAYFPKIVRDMRDAQTVEGLVPDYAPEFAFSPDGFRDSPEWGSAAVVVPWWVYRKYGDRRILEQSLPMMTRYVNYLGTKARDEIVAYGLGDWYDIGPGEPGPSKLTPRGVTATATYYQDVIILEQVNRLLGQQADGDRYAKLATRVREAFQRHFFDPKEGYYASGSQTAQAMPLVLNLCAAAECPRVLKHLVADVTDRGNQQTAGDIGHHYLVRALIDAGRPDLLFAMTSRTDPPSYGAQLARGATSLTEAWDADRKSSQNHCMLGHIEEWFYAGLAGIEADFDRIAIKPQVAGDLAWVKAWHDTVWGRVESDWKIDESGFELTVRIPANATAYVFVPGNSVEQIKEGGRPAEKAEGVRYKRREGEALVFEVESGQYTFRSSKPRWRAGRLEMPR
jgi:alpha-L-rhamnosidase